MATFEVEIEGSDLNRAMRALNDAGIPTVGSAGGTRPRQSASSGLKRFLRSRAFVIVLVIVLAFVVQRLLDPADDGTNSGDDGGSVLSLLIYFLPFLLFFAFWLFLMRRLRRRGFGQLDRLRAYPEARSAASAADQVQAAVPADGDYRIGAASPAQGPPNG